MPVNRRQRYFKIALIFFSAFLFLNIFVAPHAKAIGGVGDTTMVVADVPATTIATKNWFESAASYVLNKVGTILFQNLLRKYINDLAMDTAKYLAVGAKGQEKLYIEEKWGNFWKNVGDNATGDFIEGFANSVISDIAAKDIQNEGKALCEKQKAECEARGGTGCEATYQQCMYNSGDVGSGISLCESTRVQCESNCASSVPCLNSCRATASACIESSKQNAGGDVEQARRKPMFDSTDSPLASINICNPSLSVSLQISLGLTQYYTGFPTHCSFSEMKKNWKTEFDRQKSMMSGDFLQQMQGNFHPTGSDLGVAFLLNSNLIQYRGEQVINSQKETEASKGWLDVRNFAGDLVGTPEQAKARKTLADQAVWDNIGKITGDILVDAANIFLNQWAISSWNNLMGNLSVESKGNLSYWSGAQTGRQAIENKLSKLSEPIFSAGGKINVLTQLSACADPAKPGPTDCVISEEFSTAIENKLTVREAVRTGQLPGNWPFGFDKNAEDKLAYNQGYPYRSMLILRKYRILPVGWEVAAQEIQQEYATANPGFIALRPDGVTLNDMLSCYSPNDDIDNGFNMSWCVSLVDPNWVLKVPEYFCSRKGYGPETLKDPSLVNTGVKYCSADQGKTRTIVDSKLEACETKDDCCTDAELGTRQKLMVPGKEKELRNFACAADCSYVQQKLLVNRNDRYCADEQSCIKEGRNGSCLFYGYCTEEKRSWIFNKEKKDQTCDAIFNTCQSFKNTKGQKVSYLANTLDYGCQQSAIGCKEYSYDGVYDSGNDALAWDRTKNIYLNRKTDTCSAKQEGCHEFIRVQDNNGVNLLADGGLEASDKLRWKDDSIGRNFGTIVDNTNGQVYQGGVSLKVTSGQQVYYGPGDQSLLPAGFSFDSDRIYTLSAFVYVTQGQVEMIMGNNADPSNAQTVNTTATGEWQNLVLKVLNDSSVDADFFAIRAMSPDTEFFVDNMKLEMGSSGTYSPYRSDNLLYEKLLPKYMESVCYENPANNFNFKDSAPAKCSQFSRKCQADEVGCELYTEANTKDQTAAQVKSKDYCPKECVGYDAFIQQANNFYSARDEYFIPKTAKTCSANAVGCSLFVNLDKIKTGGEDNLYFANFRRCVKPDDANSNCAEFYTWEGSDESGYQLVVYQLQANTDTTSGISQPATVDDTDPTDNKDGDICNENMYALPYDHPQYNPDCRQFYGRDGNVSYHLMTKTITCSKECYPYRLVNNNIDVVVTDEAICANTYPGTKGHWDADKGVCIACINGGEWMDEHQACVYLADPAKSQTCGASEVGCSEYEGDFGNQVRILFYDTFEAAGLNGWGTQAELTTDSLTVGGHSMKTNNAVLTKDVSAKLNPGKRYVLSFMAKKKAQDLMIDSIIMDGNVSTNAGVGRVEQPFAEDVDITSDWKSYKYDLISFGNQEISSFKLIFNLSGADLSSLRLDNIKILEMTDTYYLIRNSWTTPATCDQDLLGNPAPLYMLGCEQYSDRANKTHYLKSFDKLCQDSAVGCELMIDTHNSSFYGAETVNTVTTPADNFAYIVYEKAKECRVADKGCSRLGQYDDLAETHKDVYLINDPDRYNDIMCTKDQVGCEAWGLEDGGETYFKDPGLRACEFRQSASGLNGWYKVKANRCVDTSNTACASDATCGAGKYCATIGQDTNGEIKRCASKFSCQDNLDCSAGTACQLIDYDETCNPTSFNKTIGLGVRAEKEQPVGMDVKDANGKIIGNAGLCPANQNTCTEYIDPESSFSYDLLIGCQANSTDCNPKLKPDTLYILKRADSPVTITCSGGGLYRLGEDNKVYGPATDIITVKQSEEFYIDGGVNTAKPVACTIISPQKAQLKEAIVNYRLKNSLNQDKPNTVNPGKGQVLFNERSFNGGKYNPLVWDVNNSGLVNDVERTPQKAPADNENNANALLKVDPDRQCATWLGCKSYTENPNKPGDKICYERGLCDQLNEAGECINFVDKDPAINQTYNPALNENLNISNLTGYAKAGYVNNAFNADMYHLATMRQEGDTKVKFDGSFENAWETDFVDFATGVTRASIVSDAKVIEKELGFGSYKVIPDGRAVGKTNVFSVKEVNDAGGRQYVVSAYVFLRYGTKVELTVGRNFAESKGSNCPFETINDSPTVLCNSGTSYATVASTDVAGRWVRLVGKFSISNSYQRTLNGGGTERDPRITIGIKPTAGLVYFDDVRLEPGLNYKDDGTTDKIKKYLHSDCRLYPESDSMSCDYYDDSGLRKKGWAGYCLEYDPRNPAVCLLWYPLDKVESEEYEEGVALNISKDLYYCVDAEDGCNADNKVEPEFFCKKFIKVDKESYWYDRITGGSAYQIPYDLLTNYFQTTKTTATSSFFYANFGVNFGGKSSDIVLNQGAGSGYYGAYPSLMPPRATKLSVGNVGGKIMPFVPYYGYSYAHDISERIREADESDPDRHDIYVEKREIDQRFCYANRDDKGNTQPIEVSDCNDCSNAEKGWASRDLGVYDDCYVDISTIWKSGTEDGCINGDNRSCGTWNSVDRTCSNKICGWNDWFKPVKINGKELGNFSDYKQSYCTTEILGVPITNTTKCQVRKPTSTNKNFVGQADDTCDNLGLGDGEEAGCFFGCYNHTNFYRVASEINPDKTVNTENSKKRAVEAVKRLFTTQDKNGSCYVWNSDLKTYEARSVESADCNLGVDFKIDEKYCDTRPDYDGSNNDYCIIRPVVSEVKLLNENLLKGDYYLLGGNGSGWVTLSFSSQVDKEQLPLRKYVISWGYQKNGYNATQIRNVNMGNLSGQRAYYFYDYDEVIAGCSVKANPGSNGCPTTARGQCCILTPTVTVTDNWDASNLSGNGKLNHPLVVYKE